MLICDYGDAGNRIGGKIYDTGGHVCSKCSADRQVCFDGLCSMYNDESPLNMEDKKIQEQKKNQILEGIQSVKYSNNASIGDALYEAYTSGVNYGLSQLQNQTSEFELKQK